MVKPAARSPVASGPIGACFAALVLAFSALVANNSHASDDAAVRDGTPQALEIASPAPLDAVFALVHSVVFDQPGADDPRWSTLYREIRERDMGFADAMAGTYQPDMHERLREWAIAYRAGLPDMVESERHLSQRDLREDSGGRHYVFAPLRYEPATLSDYADALDALNIPPEQTALWRSGGVTVLIIATNRLDQYELPVAKSELDHVDLHTTALFRTGPVETLVDTEGRHILLLPVKPVALTVHDNGKTAAERSYEDIPVDDGNTLPV